MKRVLIFSTAYLPLLGGAEVAIREITDRATDFEFDLVCARLRPGLPSLEKIGRVTVHRVGFGTSFDKFLLPFLGPLLALRVMRYASHDLLWSMQASYGGFASLFYSWMKPHVRFLLTLQEGDPFERYAKRAGPFNFLHKKIFQRPDFVQAISGYLCDWSVRMGFIGTPRLIPNGVDISRFSQRVTHNAQRQTITIISVSRLSHKNGIDLLIRAMEKIPSHVRLQLVGDGEDGEKLRALSLELGVQDRVEFLGSRPNEEIPALLREADISIRPSRSEGQGISFIESMAMGLPTIGTPVGGIPDFLKEGETGWLCEPENPESITETINRVLATPHEEVVRITQNASRLVREKYNWDTIGKDMVSLFEHAISSKRYVVATGVYPPEIGGPPIAISKMVRELEGEGNAVRVITYGDITLRDGVRRVSRAGGVFPRYLRFTRHVSRLMRSDSILFTNDIFSAGIPSRFALLFRRNPFIVRLGGEWCWEDAVTKGRFYGTLRTFWDRPADVRRRLMARNYAWILNRAGQVRVTADILGDVVKRIVPSVASRIVAAPNIPPATMQPSQEPRPHHPFRFLYIGRFAPVKNLPFLARVLKRLSDEGLRFEMRFVGDGEERPLVERILKDVPGIFFLGARPYPEAMGHLSTSDALLLPSLSDICPNVVVESEAMEIPSIITREHGLGKLAHAVELDPMDEDAWVAALKSYAGS